MSYLHCSGTDKPPPSGCHCRIGCRIGLYHHHGNPEVTAEQQGPARSPGSDARLGCAPGSFGLGSEVVWVAAPCTDPPHQAAVGFHGQSWDLDPHLHGHSLTCSLPIARPCLHAPGSEPRGPSTPSHPSSALSAIAGGLWASQSLQRLLPSSCSEASL